MLIDTRKPDHFLFLVSALLLITGIYLGAGLYGLIPPQSFWGERPPLTDSFPGIVWPRVLKPDPSMLGDPTSKDPLLRGTELGNYTDTCAGIEEECKRMREGTIFDRLGYQSARYLYKNFSIQSTQSIISPGIPSFVLFVGSVWTFFMWLRSIIGIRSVKSV